MYLENISVILIISSSPNNNWQFQYLIVLYLSSDTQFLPSIKLITKSNYDYELLPCNSSPTNNH